MAGSLFYHLGRRMGPKLRKARWLWESLTGTEADALRLEHGVGRDLAQEAARQLPLDPDPHTRQVLDEVGGRLAACVANPTRSGVAGKLRSFHFDAFGCSEPNAFALPGGFIFISRSIIELCRWDPGEVAFILGHEMGHVIRGHAIERIIANSALSFASRAAPVRGVLGGWLHRVGVQFLTTAYSRDQELEADKLGLRLIVAAGFDPQAGIRLFARLADLKNAPQPIDLGQYFATHPTCEARIASLRRFLQNASPAPGRKSQSS